MRRAFFTLPFAAKALVDLDNTRPLKLARYCAGHSNYRETADYDNLPHTDLQLPVDRLPLFFGRGLVMAKRFIMIA